MGLPHSIRHSHLALALSLALGETQKLDPDLFNMSHSLNLCNVGRIILAHRAPERYQYLGKEWELIFAAVL